ncbi:MAG: DUF2281 domain-containing protein [Chloroflexota bacterium]
METITISRINESLRKLSPDKLVEVYDFIVFLSTREPSNVTLREAGMSYALDTMLASENVLARDWDTPEEDAAWADL